MPPAYDLRSSAKIKGNRPYLPPNYAPLMHLGYAAIVICLLLSAGYFGWAMWLSYKTEQVQSQAGALNSRVKSQDHMLWLADWKSQSIPFQELMVEFFTELPPEARLSQFVARHNAVDGSIDLRIAINADRNTSSQYFREISTFFTNRGMPVISSQTNQVLGATVFEAKLKIMRRYTRPGEQGGAQAANPRPAATIAETETP